MNPIEMPLDPGPPPVQQLQPKREPLKLSSLLELPNRIINPPVVSKSSSSSSSGSKLFGKVRTLERCRMSDVNLSDILDGQHLPPLTLCEFEDYLVHVEHAPENLYFYFWLQDYTKKYRRWETIQAQLDLKKNMESKPLRMNDLSDVSKKYPASMSMNKNMLPSDLNRSLETALNTFLKGEPAKRAGSELMLELELNLTAEVKERVKHETSVSGDPSIFGSVEKEVKNMLEESMRRWLVISSGNADRLRVWFAILLGVTCVLAAIAGSILLTCLTNSHSLRLATTPLFWLGITTFVCGLHRTCPVIFIFGSLRQIHPWEAVRPISIASLENGASPITLIKPSKYPSRDGTHETLKDQSSDPKNLLSAWDANFPTHSSSTFHPTLSFSEPTHFPKPIFPHLQAFRSSRNTKSTPIFGPVTRVISPIIVRAQRSHILTGIVWACILTTVWIPLWIFIPSIRYPIHEN
ncbi:hypothetical protein CROQUDRAFT_662703 [Cronartium quercuum f. sp. fusiforme G11]|uniref:RGS domain-containing protein n=1 Tax=Cronartium quercuum f. sp. fusiforme G11 TaxID=708437 RepID=A0A9P6T9A7_9BASI|nr:hypothetical protein CROQUDRAFT_662703 [Cronartium quercuum f. sp. fusiforme G11]